MSLPLFYYPSTVVWVDDDSLFLKAVSQFFNNEYHLKTFTSPAESLAFFQNYSPLLPKVSFIRGLVEADNYDLLNHLPVDLNVNALREFRSNAERTSEVTVVVVDYNMPGMNGIELCRKLHSLPMKKILLTGEADLQKAVAAFNEGIIDGFIRKDSQNVADEIEFHLRKLTQKYFMENTNKLLMHLETEHPLPISDLRFVEYFNEFCKKNEIKEYYLIDKIGNFLLVNGKNEKYYFVVHTDRTLSKFTELHDEDKETMLFIRAVKSREKIPFFGEGVEGWQLEPYNWVKCFYSPETLIGDEKYYLTVASAA